MESSSFESLYSGNVLVECCLGTINPFSLCQVITWVINQSYLKDRVRSSPNLHPIQSLFMESKQAGLSPEQITLLLWPSLCWHSMRLDKKKGQRVTSVKEKTANHISQPMLHRSGVKGDAGKGQLDQRNQACGHQL